MLGMQEGNLGALLLLVTLISSWVSYVTFTNPAGRYQSMEPPLFVADNSLMIIHLWFFYYFN